MSWLDKILPPKIKKISKPQSPIPDGLWVKCPSCATPIYTIDLLKNLQVCPKCHYHHYMQALSLIHI